MYKKIVTKIKCPVCNSVDIKKRVETGLSNKMKCNACGNNFIAIKKTVVNKKIQ